MATYMKDNEMIKEVMHLLKKEAYPYYSHISGPVEKRWKDQEYRQLLHSLSYDELLYVLYLLYYDPDCPHELLCVANGISKYRERLSTDAIPLKPSSHTTKTRKAARWTHL